MDIKIGNKKVGVNHPTFVIAELSANHNQDFDIAVETIKAAKAAGADAIKLQTYTADTITLNCDNDYFKIKQGTVWDGKNLYNLYQEAFTPWEWQPKLKKIADELGLICFSSPFDKTAVDFLEKMNVPAYKVASFEITDVGLIKYIAQKGKPVIISTGIATVEDIEEAIKICRQAGNNQIILLKCTSEYPAPPEHMNLATIPDMAKKFKVISGLSDHTLSATSTIAAVALGAKVIEKHLILDRKIGGPDSGFSMEPNELEEMIKAIRDAEKAVGSVDYELSEKAKKSRQFSRSLFVVQDIKKGEIITEKNIRSIRPGFGLAPKHLDEILGKIAAANIKRGTPLAWDLIK
jgi:pseudaminic acid synthase